MLFTCCKYEPACYECHVVSVSGVEQPELSVKEQEKQEQVKNLQNSLEKLALLFVRR